MDKHTPGPWGLEEVWCDTEHINHFVPVAGIEGAVTSLLTIVEHNKATFAAIYSDADARLIAAAPDLLEALEVLLTSFCDPDCGEYDRKLAIKDARVAIAKAT
jgi:hypothetical protein